MASLGKRLADIRIYEGLSQREVAEVLGVSQNAISAYENNLKVPSLPKLLAFARHFDISLDYIVGFVDDKISFDRKDVIVLPKGFNAEAIPKAKEYIRLLMK